MDACAQRLRGFGAGLRRARWRLAAWCAICVVLALAYALSVPAQFVARVDVAIAPQAVADDGPEDVRHFHQIDLDSQQAATELQVLESERLLRPVFENLGLAQSPELAQWRDGFWSIMAHYAHALSPEGATYADRERAYFSFVNRVRCLRIGMSYVFEISYRSHDPALAARVANAVASEYLAYRIERARMRQMRIGGAYQAARSEALTQQWQASRAAAKAGVAPAEDLYTASARILGPAEAPLNKSYPKLAPTLALGAGIGLLSGVLAIVGFAAPVGASRTPPSPRLPHGRPRDTRRALSDLTDAAEAGDGEAPRNRRTGFRAEGRRRSV